MANIIDNSDFDNIQDEVSSSTRVTFQYLGKKSSNTIYNVAVSPGCIIFDTKDNAIYIAAGTTSDHQTLLIPLSGDTSTFVVTKGGTLTNGKVTLSSDPKSSMEAATKHYVDTQDSTSVSTANAYTDLQVSTGLTSAANDAQSRADKAKNDAIVQATSNINNTLNQYVTISQMNDSLNQKITDINSNLSSNYTKITDFNLLVRELDKLQTLIATKNSATLSDTAPTNPVKNDVWVDTSSDNVAKIYDGYDWIVIGSASSTEKINVTGISISTSSLTISGVKTSSKLSAIISPDNATDKSVKWASSDPNTVSVSDSGVVTSIKTGSATITVTTNDGGYSASCQVTVVASSVAVTGITISKSSATLTSEGDTITLAANVTPDNATNKSVKWTSSNTGFVTVTAATDNTATVTAVANGISVIRATSVDGNYTAECTITVAIQSKVDTDIDVPTQDLTYFPTATEMRTNMGPGWNYGDQFESSAGTTEADVRCFGQSGGTTTTDEGLAAEVAFGKPVGTQGLFTALYTHGIRTVRIPVAWGRHVIKSADGTYSISKPFLDRIKTVVNYAYKAGLHIILNDHGDAWDYFSGWSDSKVIHHNDFTSNSFSPFMIFNANDNPDPDRQVFAATTIWTLIANAFKDYDGHLMFEGCTNEILASHRNSKHNKARTESWPNIWSASRSWYEQFNDGYTLEQMQAVVDKLNNAFISAVRATGGNNAKRVLQVQPLGAIATVSDTQPSDWVTHMTITDSATDRIMIQIHVYSNGWTTQAATSKIFNKWTTETKYPIVLGETGNALSNTSNISFYTAATFIGAASKQFKIPAILWDNGKSYDTSSKYKNGAEVFKYIDRTTYETAVLPTSKGMLDPLKAFVDSYNGSASAGDNYVTGITIDNWPGSLEASYEGAIDTSSLTATATYLNGSTKSIPNSSLSFSIPSADGTMTKVTGHASSNPKENECYMTASYTEDGITVSKGALRIVVTLPSS